MAGSLQLTFSGGIFSGTPTGSANLADALAPGQTLVELDSVILTSNRAPLGYLVFADSPITPATDLAFWVGFTTQAQEINFQAFGQPFAPFLPGALYYGWSFLPDTFDSVIAKLPSADLELLFTLRYLDVA